MFNKFIYMLHLLKVSHRIRIVAAVVYITMSIILVSFKRISIHLESFISIRTKVNGFTENLI